MTVNWRLGSTQSGVDGLTAPAPVLMACVLGATHDGVVLENSPELSGAVAKKCTISPAIGWSGAED